MAEYLSNLPYIIGTTILLALPTLYYLALPRVLPGIPHNKESARTIRGDIPAFIAHTSATSEICSFFARQCFDLKSPLVQIFLKPFSKYPFLILSDYREIEDMITRRTREFDRSDQTTIFFESVVPYGTIQMKSHDTFKTQRRLWAPTMSTAFLHEAAALHVHSAILEFVALWRRKAALAEAPFEASVDLEYLTLDAIWAIALGDQLNVTKMRREVLDSPDAVSKVAESPVKHVTFADAELPPIVRAIENLLYCTGGISKSPFPSLYQIFMRRRPWYRRDWATKEETMANLIRDCRQAFNDNTDPEGPVSSAMELVLKREHAQLLKNPGAVRDPEDRQIKDELFTFLLAGNETTTTTLSWFVKYMSNHQEIQNRLRHALGTSFPKANGEPSPKALLGTDVPYLDAVVEESLRVSRTAGGIVRQAVVDTELLGYRIPAGTSIFCIASGDSYSWNETISTDDSKRSTSSKASADKYHPWSFEGKQNFTPERWLKSTPDGQVFDGAAGPSLPFSAGARGCFGKKLAYLELKMIIALMVINFKLEPIAQELNGDEAEETVTRKPKQCYVKLTAVA